MKQVYLAGPITGWTFGKSQEWRTAMAEIFAQAGVRALSPLRGKHYLESFGKLENQYHGVHPLSDPSGITTRDRNDVFTADLVLANFLGAERVSIGTMIELGWADARRVPVIAVMEEENPHHHAMVHEIAGYVVKTLEEAVPIALTVLGFDVKSVESAKPDPVVMSKSDGSIEPEWMEPESKPAPQTIAPAGIPSGERVGDIGGDDEILDPALD